MRGMNSCGFLELVDAFAFDAEPGAVGSEAEGALVYDADFDETPDAAFPVGNGAGEVFEVAAVGAV